jgi:hypothetical protein
MDFAAGQFPSDPRSYSWSIPSSSKLIKGFASLVQPVRGEATGCKFFQGEMDASDFGSCSTGGPLLFKELSSHYAAPTSVDLSLPRHSTPIFGSYTLRFRSPQDYSKHIVSFCFTPMVSHGSISKPAP